MTKFVSWDDAMDFAAAVAFESGWEAMDDTHIHVWTWDDERPGYSKCKECFIRKNEEKE